MLDGGETIKAEGAIDARGATNMSALELLYEARLERDYRFKAPHRVDRPVLVDATDRPGRRPALLRMRALVRGTAARRRRLRLRARPAGRAGGRAARRLCEGARLGAAAGARRAGGGAAAADRRRLRRFLAARRGARGQARPARRLHPSGHRADASPTRRTWRCCSAGSATSPAARSTICSRPRPSSSGSGANSCARSPPRSPRPRPRQRRGLIERLYRLDPALLEAAPGRPARPARPAPRSGRRCEPQGHSGKHDLISLR